MSNERVAIEDYLDMEERAKAGEHVPAISNGVQRTDNYVVGCSCGWNSPFFWGAAEGARTAWVQHVLDTYLPPEWHVVAEVDLHTTGGL